MIRRIAQSILGKVAMPAKTLSESRSVAAIIAAVKPAALIELESQRDDLQKRLQDANRRMGVESERSSRQFSSPIEIKTDETMAAAAARAAQLSAEIDTLQKTLSELRKTISAAKASSGVAEALMPHRCQAASDVRLAVEALYGALARFNAASIAIEAESGRPTHQVPATIPIVDHILQKVEAD
jgi:chromosome segregation ATPase